MKTIYDVLVAMGPKLEDHWNQHSELTDGAARSGVVVAETLNDLSVDPVLKMQVVDLILKQPILPNNPRGLIQFWKDLIVANRS